MKKFKVLVIEDDETALMQLSRVVRKEGFEVFEAGNGAIGLDIFDKENPEIVITDLKMPGIGGLEVLHTVKNKNPNTQIIIITAFGEIDVAILAIRKGAIDYIKKPIDLEQLILALGRAREKAILNTDMPIFPSILLAEDDESARFSLKRVLRKEGWNVDEAANGAIAVEHFKKHKYDIVLLDIKMPKKDGLTALKEMKEVSEDFEAIILTGYGNESDAIQSMRSGAINFLKKPIDLEQMLISVEKAIEKLTLKRALKYRNRELEIMREIVTRITSNREIVIDVGDNTDQRAWEFVKQIIEAIEVGIIVCDKDYKILFVTEKLSKIIGFPESIFDGLDNQFLKIGVEITDNKLKEDVDSLMKLDLGTIKTRKTGNFSYIALSAFTIKRSGKLEKVILMLIRGERK